MFREKNNDIIIISSIDWNTQRQVVHELSEQLSKDKNNRILFIENTSAFLIQNSEAPFVAIKLNAPIRAPPFLRISTSHA